MLARFVSKDAQNFRPSAIRAFAKWINDPRVISFAGGSPNPETFPAARFAEIAARVLRDRGRRSVRCLLEQIRAGARRGRRHSVEGGGLSDERYTKSD